MGSSPTKTEVLPVLVPKKLGVTVLKEPEP